MPDLSRCAIHTMTTKPWSLAEACDRYAAAGVTGISIWRNAVDPAEGGPGVAEAVKIAAGSGLAVPAYVRGGFFPAHDEADRQKAIDENRTILDEAAALGAEQVVLVVGAVPGLPLSEARQHVRAGIESVLPHARSLGVRLSIEPLHPMYAGDKSCINRMAEAREIWQSVRDDMLGVAVDVYHVWWDPDLDEEIRLAGEANKIFGFHVCDWRIPTRDLLLDRAIMGEGCIDIPAIRAKVEAAGFQGFNEVEIFSTELWQQDQNDVLARVVEAYRTAV